LKKFNLTNNFESKISKGLYKNISFPYKVPRNHLILHTDSSKYSSNLINSLGRYQSTLNSYNSIMVELASLELILNKQKQKNKSFFDDLKDLEEIGFVSKPSILQSMSSINNLESQIVNLRVETTKLHSQKDQELATLKMALNSYIKGSLLYSSSDIYIHQTSMNSGDYITPDIPIITYTTEKNEAPQTIPVFSRQNLLVKSRKVIEVMPHQLDIRAPK
jgi:hypothetical protein